MYSYSSLIEVLRISSLYKAIPDMIDVYLKKGEKEKALDVFNKNKKIIKYWMPPANYVQLAKRLGVIW